MHTVSGTPVDSGEGYVFVSIILLFRALTLIPSICTSAQETLSSGGGVRTTNEPTSLRFSAV